jgi:DNA-binding response OmpR family regulator
MAKLIMVVNDTQEILGLFRALLTDAGYEVSLHSYGKREVQEVQEVAPDLIISDWPPLDREVYGWQFLQMLKMTRETAHIPVVVCTTNLRAIQDNQAWMMSKGIRVVAKPFDIDELYAAIEELLGKADEPGLGPTARASHDLAGPTHEDTDQASSSEALPPV